MTRVAAIGTGAVGLYFAGHLAASGIDVVACVRRPFDEYVIESDTTPLRHAAIVETDPRNIEGPFDVVLVAVKAHQTEGAAEWMRRCCSAETIVVVMQNGVEHDRVVPFIQGATMLPSVVRVGAELLAPGHMRHTAAGSFTLPTGSASERVARLFSDSPAGVKLTDDFVTDQWLKLAGNTVANGLSALTDRPMGVVSHPPLREVATRLVFEVGEVARADGADLDDAALLAVIESISRRGGVDGIPSTLQDIRAGRPTEHDAIHGAVIRRAERYGVDVRTVRTIHALLDARQQWEPLTE